MPISKSTTKSLYAPSGSTAWTLQVEFTESSTNATNNTSTISLSCYLQSGGGSFSSGTNNTLVLVWHDNNENTDKVISILNVKSISANSWAETSGTYTATHKDDGSLSGYAKVVWTKNDNNGWVPASGTLFAAGGDSPSYTALTAIARPSVPTLNKTSFTLGEAVTINTNRKSSSFTHTIRINHPSFNEPILLVTKTTAASYTMTSLQASNLQTAILNLGSTAKSYSITFEVITYNGSTAVGTRTVTGTANLTATVHGPTISDGTVSPPAIIKNQTTATVSVKATAKPGATITSVTCANGTQTAQMVLSGEAYTCQMSNLTSKDFAISATDSRGFITSSTVSAGSYSEYIQPTVRSSSYSSSNYILSFSGVWTSTGNTLAAVFRVNGESSWHNTTSLTAGTDVFNGTINLQNYNISSSQDYLVEIKFTDNQGDAVYSHQIKSDSPLFWLGKETARCGKHWIFEGDGQNGEIEIYPSANGGIRWGGTTITKAIFDTLPSGGGGGGGITQEVDPTVPAWAKASTKPTYTASEVGAIPAPSSGSTGQVLKKTASGVEWANESDPTVSSWAKAATKPTYTASEVGALPSNTFIPEYLSQLVNDILGISFNQQTGVISINLGVNTYSAVDKDYADMAYDYDQAISDLDRTKITAPSGGSTGQFLQKTASGTQWATVSAGGTQFAITDGQNVYPFVRAVELTSSGVEGLYLTFDDNTLEGLSYFLPDGVGLNNVLTSVNQAIAGKIDMPSGGSPEYFLKKTASGVAWSGIPGGADEIAWTGGNLGQQTAPADVEGAITAVFNYINSLDASNTEY